MKIEQIIANNISIDNEHIDFKNLNFIIDKEIVKKDLVDKYFYSKINADFWVAYNFEILKDLIRDRAKNVKYFLDDFQLISLYEDELESLVL